MLPAYFQGMFNEVFLIHNHDTRNKSEPVPGLWKSIAAKNSIRFALPTAIAIAPTDILEKINLDDIKLPSFSKTAKLLFLDEYKTECVIENCYVCNEIEQKSNSPEST